MIKMVEKITSMYDNILWNLCEEVYQTNRIQIVMLFDLETLQQVLVPSSFKR